MSPTIVTVTDAPYVCARCGKCPHAGNPLWMEFNAPVVLVCSACLDAEGVECGAEWPAGWMPAVPALGVSDGVHLPLYKLVDDITAAELEPFVYRRV
jgi:hypothetical protein